MAFRSRGIIASLMVLVVLASGTMVAFSASAAKGPPPPEWTVALYVAVDNNLEAAWDQYSIPSLLAIPASKDVNVVAMVDRLSTEGTELIRFSGDTSEVVATYPEMNSGSGETFSFFLDEVEALYPSEKLCVIPWDHGGSWRGFCGDDSQVGLIRMNQFSDALTDAGAFIDVLAFDACIMSATEVAYEAYTTGMVDYIVASEMYVPYDSFPYDLMLTPLTADPAAAPEDLCTMMLDGWEAYYHNGRKLNLVVTDVSVLGEGLPVFQAWSDALLAGLGTYEAQYATAIAGSIGNDYVGTMVDIYDFCEQVVAYVPDQAIADASTAVMAIVNASVVGIVSGGWAAEMHGLTIWWASLDYLKYLQPYLDQVQFATDAGWGELQTAYVS